MERQGTIISWDYPQPRGGLWRYWDEFIGPGATAAEVALMAGAALLAGIAVPAYALAANLGWSWLQLLVAALLAFDIAGGVVTNAASVAKRWYHRPGQGWKQQLAFTAIHIHPLLVSALFMGMDWAFFLLIYGYLLAAAAAVLFTPLYLRRPLALGLYGIGVVLGLYLVPAAPGLEWFVPLFYLKLLVAHLVREEPYRPDH